MKSVLLLSALSLTAAASANADDWTYEGEHGPDHWGGVCTTGIQQSPIDFTASVSADIDGPTIDWSGAEATAIINNGHTLQVNFGGDARITLDGADYSLLQLHFHTPSEHTVEGVAYPMEVHFVHADEGGQLAVIGVFFEAGDSAAALDPIWAAAPASEGEAEFSEAVNLAGLLPTEGGVLRYAGSLTTPPCSEIVSWTVMETPISASQDQIETFVSLFGDNARPTLPLNRRYVLTNE